jgi:voltage-gated potassium channel
MAITVAHSACETTAPRFPILLPKRTDHPFPGISNYVDTLYFTVTALTTTGFGDIVLPGTAGRLISVIIMVFGVSLRLVQVMLRPSKVEYKCPDCGLKRHEYDAVHCKACGRLLNIEDEGLV